MIVGCIDIGSNTTRLLVAEAGGGSLRELVTQRAFTRIGRSLGKGGAIPPEKMRGDGRGGAAHRRASRARWAPRSCVAVATAAIRNAANRDELCGGGGGRRSGLPLRVLSGERGGAAVVRRRRAHPGPARRPAPWPWWTWAAAPPRSRSARPTASVEWSESFRDRARASWPTPTCARDPPSVAELETRPRPRGRGVRGAGDPRRRTTAVAVGGTATSLRRLVGAELAHETLERGVRVLSATPDRRGGRAVRARPRARAAAAGRASSCWRPCRTASGCRCGSPAAGCARA